MNISIFYEKQDSYKVIRDLSYQIANVGVDLKDGKTNNMEVDIDENLESRYKGLYIIGDGSGVTHSLSHASASGVYVARQIVENL